MSISINSKLRIKRIIGNITNEEAVHLVKATYDFNDDTTTLSSEDGLVEIVLHNDLISELCR